MTEPKVCEYCLESPFLQVGLDLTDILSPKDTYRYICLKCNIQGKKAYSKSEAVRLWNGDESKDKPKKAKLHFKMPKNLKEFYATIENAFLAGCTWGYGVDHGKDMSEQEQLGVDQYIGKITPEEAHTKMLEIWNSEE